MRFVDWNIEHMNSWFVPNDDLNSPSMRASYPGGGFGGGQIDDVPALAQRAANVLSGLDPDVICIQEGAGEEEVALFLNQFLPLPNAGTWTVLGGAGGAQKLIVAARTDRDVASAVLADDSGMTVQLDADYEADTDGDAVLESDTDFARIPLVVDLLAHGQNLRIINCHLKSKYVPDGEDLFNGTQAEHREFIRAALVNRRRISAEAFRIRTYLDELFDANPDRLALLAGDLNDGPGFDFFERRYLTHSVVDLAFGSVLLPEGRLTHPLIQSGQPRPSSAFFDDFVEGIQNKPLLLDHIGLSPALSTWLDSARIANGEFDAEAQPGAAQERERLPSDHRPVFAVLTPPT
jgi:endonuclease/exonuclease/phosphatase family metal-dependent hydrolase